MKIILLSGGSGKRLWPLSNNSRSKQFLHLLTAPDGGRESMVQRIVRQIKKSDIEASMLIATSESQSDMIISQLGEVIDIVTEPMRRDTFPAVALSACFLHKEKNCSRDEVVVVMPSDSYVDSSYFDVITKMADAIDNKIADMVLMGIVPTEPSTKFGYIAPNKEVNSDIISVSRFTEKPDEVTARELIEEGAVWNGGVFTFRLGYIMDIVEKYISIDNNFNEIRSRYAEFPKISFDYEVVEKAQSIAYAKYSGVWSDLGTWNSLTEKIDNRYIGNVVVDDKTINTHIVNELDIPVITLGADNLIVAASPDGILVSSKEESVNLKSYADKLTTLPKYEERRWGTFKVIEEDDFEDGNKALTRILTVKACCNTNFQYHKKMEVIWTFVDGEGEMVLDDKMVDVSRGCVVHIKPEQRYAIKAITDMKIVEVQLMSEYEENDIFTSEFQVQDRISQKKIIEK